MSGDGGGGGLGLGEGCTMRSQVRTEWALGALYSEVQCIMGDGHIGSPG